MYHAHVYIVPVIVFYGAMALPFPLMLLLAFFAGTMLDALTVQVLGARVEISLGWSIIAGALGIVVGTLFMAFHASQGPRLGLPQMIQSRAQFGGADGFQPARDGNDRDLGLMLDGQLHGFSRSELGPGDWRMHG